MRILVLGAGGIGGFFGGHLAQAGADVTFLVRERRAAQLQQRGLIVDSPLGDIRAAVVAATDARDVVKPDIVVLTCKAYDLVPAMEAVALAVGAGTVVLPLLNGLAHIDRLVARFPAAAIWGGLAHLGVELSADGVVRHLNDLSVVQFGARGSAQDARAFELERLFGDTPVHASARPVIEQDMWDKLVFLATLAGMTCLMRASVGRIMAMDSGERLTLQLLDECIAVAEASGFPPSTAHRADFRSQLTRRGSPSTASMLRDITRGSRTEGEHILGDMLARARRVAVNAPLLDIALTHVQAYEAARGAS